MKIYCTRHGQPDAGYYIKNDNRFPAYDIPLTSVGTEQAIALGKYLKALGFGGKIYSSPYRRTMQTASVIAKELNLPFTVLHGIREIRFGNPFRGLTAQELKDEFPLCQVDELPYPWWTENKETMADVKKRVGEAVDAVIGNKSGPDVLFVGHGASVCALVEHLGITNQCTPVGIWNCCLCMLDTKTGQNYSGDTSFLPNDLITDNSQTLQDVMKSQANK